MRRRRWIIALACLAMLTLPGRLFASTYTVDDTGDGADANAGDDSCATAGAVCTFRAAIEEANAHAGTDTIAFNIAGAEPHTIAMSGANVTASGNDTIIDCTTQENSSCGTAWYDETYTEATPTIILSRPDGTNLVVSGDGVTVRGCKFTGGDGTTGLSVTGDGATVQCNVFDDLLLCLSAGAAADNTLIGGSSSGNGNIVTNCDSNTIIIGEAGNAATGNVIRGNDVSNGTTGIVTYGQDGAIVDRNWVHDNLPGAGVGNGVNVPNSVNVVVTRNYLGTNRTGTAAAANHVGVHCSDSNDTVIGHLTDPDQKNIISGNQTHGVSIESTCDGTVVARNIIGLQADESTPLCNGYPQINDEGTNTTTANNSLCVATPTPTPALGCCEVSGPFTCADRIVLAAGGISDPFDSVTDCQSILDTYVGSGTAHNFNTDSYCSDPGNTGSTCPAQAVPAPTPTPKLRMRRFPEGPRRVKLPPPWMIERLTESRL